MDAKVARQTDRVILRQIPFSMAVGLDAWGRDKPQPVLLSIEIPYDFQKAAASDNVSHTLDYGKLYKSLIERLKGPYGSAPDLAMHVRGILRPIAYLQAEIVLPKGNLRATGGLHFTLKLQAGESPTELVLTQGLRVNGIHCACIVGVNSHEREEKQVVVVNLDFNITKSIEEAGDREGVYDLLSSDIKESIPGVPHADVIRKVVTVSTSIPVVPTMLLTMISSQQVEGSTYQTVEALATAIAKTITVTFDINGVWVEVEKPNAIAAIEAAGVRIYREKTFFTEDNFWQIRRP